MATRSGSAYEKALKIVNTWEGRLPSRTIKEKIVNQCKITASSASTYYYQCVAEMKKNARYAR